MSSTIDMQRQRVEQEMTKMVDNLDKTFLRKVQVRIEIEWNRCFSAVKFV